MTEMIASEDEAEAKAVLRIRDQGAGLMFVGEAASNASGEMVVDEAHGGVPGGWTCL